MIKIKRIEHLEIKPPDWKVLAILIFGILCYLNKDYLSFLKLIEIFAW